MTSVGEQDDPTGASWPTASSEAAPAGASAPVGTGSDGHSVGENRILHVEDDQGQAYLIRRALERDGYRVDLAGDIGECLALVRTATFDALIVDQNLPQGSGIDLIRTLMETGGAPATIMLTGAGNEAVAVEAMKLGVSDYLTKDIDGTYLSVLPSVVKKAVAQRRIQEARQRAEAALELGHAQLLSILECLDGAIYVADLDTHQILFVNDAMKALRPGQPLMGEKCYRALRGLEDPCAQCANSPIALLPGEVHRSEHHDPTNDHDYAITYRLIRWPDRRQVRFAYMQDITDRKRAEDRLAHLAYHDILTGLPNRQLLRDRLENVLALAERHRHFLGLIFLDIDNFKSVNDVHGHRAGDVLLRSASKRLQSAVRRSDTVGRLGGDEFLVLLPELVQPEDVAHIAEKIVRVMRLPFNIDGCELSGTCSVGTVVYPRDGTTSDELLANADEALYRAKSAGGSRTQIYSPLGDRPGERTSTLRESLALAIETEQLVVHYQPLVSLRTRKVLGAEALVRWRHPTRGLLDPDEFLPFADGIGMGPSIDCWVLKKACEEARTWRQVAGRKMRISVNLSLFQMKAPDLCEQVRAILAATGFAPRRLDLEVTESMASEEIATCTGQIESLRNLGVRFSLDDFGTGSTSISHLHRLPISGVKIDQSLVHAATDGPKYRSVISAITAFAHKVGLTVVAEGVETEEQAKLVSRCGCDVGQGYVFARPMSAESFVNLLEVGAGRVG